MRRIVSLVILVLFTGMLVLAACKSSSGGNEINANDYLANVPAVEDLTGTDTTKIIGLEDGVLTVGMECAYAPL